MHENILEKLVENSRKAIDSGVYEIDEDISEMQSDFDLKEAMLQDKHPTLICEIKYASPSAGRIREDKDAAIIAQEMIKGGASALSVLTQPHMFSGSPEILMRVRKSVNVPILMKDIIIDTVQIDAGKKMGADYILLIQAVYPKGGINKMVEYAQKSGLGVLLEVHTKDEMDAAVDIPADLVGINNRSLETLQIDTGTVERLLKDKSAGPFVAESGIKDAHDIVKMHTSGAKGFLIGSSIMSSDDISAATRAFAEAY